MIDAAPTAEAVAAYCARKRIAVDEVRPVTERHDAIHRDGHTYLVRVAGLYRDGVLVGTVRAQRGRVTYCAGARSLGREVVS